MNQLLRFGYQRVFQLYIMRPLTTSHPLNRAKG